MQDRAGDLLKNSIAVAQSVPSNATGGHTTATAWVTGCTDQDPAHVGVLDPTQRWGFEGGTLRSNSSGAALCVDASQGHTSREINIINSE